MNDSLVNLTYSELSNKFDEFINIPVVVEKPRDPSIFQISSYPHYENVISNWYEFFFKPENIHGLNDLFLKSLVEIINEVKGNDFYMDTCSVIREFHTKNGGSIDLVLYESEGDDPENMNRAIIIENKVYAELDNDLNDYYLSVNVNNEKNKIGVVLSLKIIDVEDERYINITHERLLERVRQNLGNYITTARSRYITYLQDFIFNLEEMTRPKKMQESIKYYYDRAETVSQLLELRKNAYQHITDELYRELPRAGWEWGQIGSQTISFRKPELGIVGYFYHSEIFEKRKFKIELWLNGPNVLKWNDVKDFQMLEEKFGKLLKIKKSGLAKEWSSLAVAEYNIDNFNQIENIGNHVIETLSREWEPFCEEVKRMLDA